jgi:hypothetical protein
MLEGYRKLTSAISGGSTGWTSDCSCGGLPAWAEVLLPQHQEALTPKSHCACSDLPLTRLKAVKAKTWHNGVKNKATAARERQVCVIPSLSVAAIALKLYSFEGQFRLFNVFTTDIFGSALRICL